MTSNMKITYLENSGFIVETQNYNLLFDYYMDPAGEVERRVAEGKKLHVFASHIHHDHFNPRIGVWREQVKAYFLSHDIAGLANVAEDQTVIMAPYEQQGRDGLNVYTYGSTDEGVSFLVEADGWRIFHAGDLNWWHWQGDHPYNLLMAKESFELEISRLAGQHLDVAFFPVDSRLRDCRAMGATEFCRRLHVKRLVAMHTRGQRWQPPADFPGAGKHVAVWCPMQPGEELQVEKQ